MSDEISDMNIVALSGRAWRKRINSTYTFANNSLFGALIPKVLQGLLLSIKLACAWLDGYVPTLHNQRRAGGSSLQHWEDRLSIAKGFTRQVIGERLIFRKANKDADAKKSLTYISKWVGRNQREGRFSQVSATLWLSALPRSKSTKRRTLPYGSKRAVSITSYRGTANKVEEFLTMLSPYVNTMPDGNARNFILAEHEYFAT